MVSSEDTRLGTVTRPATTGGRWRLESFISRLESLVSRLESLVSRLESLVSRLES